jgi:hypothetical protein
MFCARAALILPLLGVAAGCGKGHAPFANIGGGTTVSHDAGPDGSGFIGTGRPPPPPTDAGFEAGVCGRLVLPLVVDRPNLYFVIDVSGSMVDPIPGVPSKYDAAQVSIQQLLRKVGHRVSYGAALFPDPTSNEACPLDKEVFPTVPGDTVAFALTGTDGPVLKSLLRILASYAPNGLTPTAAALTAVRGTLSKLSGKTYAFLLTDGAPNCNAAAACAAQDCTINIGGGCSTDPTLNCCDPQYGYADYRWCVDADQTVRAVADLQSAGVQTFVIGMPDTQGSPTASAYFADLLDRLAQAGGTARKTEPLYYPAGSGDELSSVLQQIGLAVAFSCDVQLSKPPPDPDYVDVYFENGSSGSGPSYTIVPFDPTDGWTWVAPDKIRLVGPHCDALLAGAAFQLDVVARCPGSTM